VPAASRLNSNAASVLFDGETDDWPDASGWTAKGPSVVWTADCLLLRRAALTNQATPAQAQKLRDRTSPKEIGLAQKRIA